MKKKIEMTPDLRNGLIIMGLIFVLGIRIGKGRRN